MIHACTSRVAVCIRIRIIIGIIHSKGHGNRSIFWYQTFNVIYRIRGKRCIFQICCGLICHLGGRHLVRVQGMICICLIRNLGLQCHTTPRTQKNSSQGLISSLSVGMKNLVFVISCISKGIVHSVGKEICQMFFWQIKQSSSCLQKWDFQVGSQCVCPAHIGRLLIPYRDGKTASGIVFRRIRRSSGSTYASYIAVPAAGWRVYIA